MQPRVFRLAVDHHAGSLYGRNKPAVDDARMGLNLSAGIRKNQILVAFRAGELPLLERVGDKGPERHHTLTRRRFGLPDFIKSISVLANVYLIGFEVYVLP